MKTNKKHTSSRKSDLTPGCTEVTFSDVTKVHPALKQLLGYCLFKVATRFRTSVQESLKPLKIHVHHMAIMLLLSDNRPLNQNQVCDELGIDKASMVKLIDHLEKLKAIARISSQEDRRVKFLTLTPKGRQFLEKARSIRQDVENKFLQSLSSAEQAAFRATLVKLLEN